MAKRQRVVYGVFVRMTGGLNRVGLAKSELPYGGSFRLAMASRKRRIMPGWVRDAIRCILLEHLGHCDTSRAKTIWSNCAHGVLRPYLSFLVSSVRMQQDGEGLGSGDTGTTMGRSLEWGANSPKYRTESCLGGGTRDAKRPISSSPLKIRMEVPSGQGVFIWKAQPPSFRSTRVPDAGWKCPKIAEGGNHLYIHNQSDCLN